MHTQGSKGVQDIPKAQLENMPGTGETKLVIGVLKGDGIGPEITKATKAVLESTGVPIEWRDIPVAQEAIDLYGHPLAPEVVQQLRQTKFCLKAPIIVEQTKGRVTCEQPNGELITYPSLNNAIRRELGHFVNVRPIRGFAGISGDYANLDVVTIREITEDVYIGHEHMIGDLAAEAIKLTTRHASLRIAKYAFEYALREDRKKITCLHKAGVLNLTDGLFRRCFYEVAAQYPMVKADDVIIDAACYHIIRDPARFDVVVAPNQYGDIFSDIVAGLVGSLGLAPGANIADENCMFEASHGAAPDIAGKGIANPLALIMSGVELLKSALYEREALIVQDVIAEVLRGKDRLTPDLGGRATTEGLTAALVRGVTARVEARDRPRQGNKSVGYEA